MMPPSPLLGLTNTDVRSPKLNVIYNFYLQASIGLQQQEIFNSDNFYNPIRSIHNRLLQTLLAIFKLTVGFLSIKRLRRRYFGWDILWIIFLTFLLGSPFDCSLFCQTDIETLGKTFHVVLIMETVAVQMNIFELITKQTAVLDSLVPLAPMRWYPPSIKSQLKSSVLGDSYSQYG